MKIKDYAIELKLPYIKNNSDDILKEARETKPKYEEFLKNILKLENDQRKENRIKNRLREAKFSHKKYCEEYKRDHLQIEVKKKVEEFETLDFIEDKENIILIGNPGTGKTHLAIGLGMAACYQNKKVLFITVPNLIIELKEAMSNSQIHSYKKKFEKYDLVILDELGYISFDKEGSEILFNLLSSRNNKGSVIITSNLTFDRWEEIFKDPVLTGAIIDRLAHKSHIVDLTGDSYRVKETEDWLSKKQEI